MRGSFDDVRSLDIRFLEEAAKTGPVHVLLDPEAPKFSSRNAATSSRPSAMSPD
ncbi:MAG: hypothetical protein U1F77_08335 [Kiritimatiellia bacterium]